jgi:hypothetical protein
MLDYLGGKMKTPEELAEEYTKDWWGNLPEAEGMRKSAKENFLAGYKAAQEHAHAALEEAEARIQELRDQLMKESGGRLKLFKNDADAKAAYLEALEDADTCDHILDMEKMVDVNGWVSVKDRMPKKEGEYLAFGYSASDAARWIVVMYDPRDECWYELSSDWDWTDDVTHWQELPEPPKEEE